MDTPHFRPDFVIIPYPVYSDEKLEGLDRVVYGVVYWFEHMRDGRCTASNATIAAVTGTNLRSVSNSLNRLEDRGYISRLYKDDAKRNRSEIRTKISFKSVSRSSATWMKPDSSLDERRDPRLDEQISNINKVKEKSILAATAAPWILEEKLEEMEKTENSYLDIIATFIRKKPVTVENSKQLSNIISRYCRIAKLLSGAYTNDQIFRAVDKIKKDNSTRERRGDDVVDFTLETVYKNLTK